MTLASEERVTLSKKILLWMLAGLVTGVLINNFASESEFIKTYITQGLFYTVGAMFIQLLKILVVPLVFCSLTHGIFGMKDLKVLGRAGSKTLGVFILTTLVAISFGVFLAVSFKVGEEFDLKSSMTNGFVAKEAPALSDIVVGIVPDNVFGAMASGDMLQLITICVLIGIAIIRTGEKGEGFKKAIISFNHVMMDLVHVVMLLSPYGVFCLIAKTFAEQGLEALTPMAGYFATIVLALAMSFVGTFSGLFILGGLNPVMFMKKMRSVFLFAFSSASSNATLPVTLETTERRLGVDNSIASFVISLGSTLNMNGTAIMLGVASVFIANAYGIELSVLGYLTIVGMGTFASMATAGIPGAGLIMLSMVLNQVGLPVEGIALVVGVDRLLDMLRTVVNVTGDVATACVVAKSEGKLDMKIYDDPDAGSLKEKVVFAPQNS